MARRTQAALAQGHQPWRGDPVSLAEVNGRAVHGFGTPVVTRVAGTDRYVLADKGSSDSITVRAVRLFTGESRGPVAEIAGTR